ncbi:disintegrin and metalloproteinase domain-containing protein 30-like [Monodelphis domestica]|uniref:Disintegrin and metalloproteinase domain-containing protein 30-like n=1 Tax=Monodelphis domestica TaxID=13616 RepID=F7FQQ2_MONDO|nr:disintegrin and metalloproteinase domain-containing protein 30-like [Monodelphis domestica]
MGSEGALNLSDSLLLLGLGTLLLDLGCLAQDLEYRPDLGHHREKTVSYEVFIPRQLVPHKRNPDVAGQITYLLMLEGKKLVIHLQPKNFHVSRHLRVFSFTKWGARLEDQPYIPSNCSYRGYVEGSPNSLATLNTCFGGLRGLVNMYGSFYQIEPLNGSTKFEHVVYRLRKKFEASLSCGAIDEETDFRLSKDRHRKISPKFPLASIRFRYIESFIVISNGRYKLLGSNMTACINEGLTLMALADTVYQTLNCRVYASGIEVWTDEDKININDSEGDNIYEDFLKYKEQLDYDGKVDWAHLIVSKNIAIKAKVGGTCDKGSSASVSSLPQENLSGSNEYLHALGHIVGMRDDRNHCACWGPDRCLMDSNPGDGGFSNCSFADYFEKRSAYEKCMSLVPKGKRNLFAKCGNKVVEGNEQCDCGTWKDCEQDRCCEPRCKLKAKAKCGFGLCCYNCKYQVAGKLCRPRISECDLEEFCNGTSHRCPYNSYIQDGTPCSDQSYCFKGMCNSHNQQCKALFGLDAVSGPLACYREANRGDRFGNCGTMPGGYVRCKSSNVLCGRLQCVNVKGIPVLANHYKVVMNFVPQGNLKCWGTDYHPTSSVKKLDLGDVREGTACGKGFLCINKTCTSVNLMNFNCTVDKCMKRGLCNNNKNCHCNYGWAPPFCKNSGFGGSIDSGPAPKLVKSPWKVAMRLTVFLSRCLTLVVSGFLTGKTPPKLKHPGMKKKESRVG